MIVPFTREILREVEHVRAEWAEAAWRRPGRDIRTRGRFAALQRLPSATGKWASPSCKVRVKCALEASMFRRVFSAVAVLAISVPVLAADTPVRPVTFSKDVAPI